MTFRYVVDAGGGLIESGNSPDAQALQAGHGVHLEVSPGVEPQIVQKEFMGALDAFREVKAGRLSVSALRRGLDGRARYSRDHSEQKAHAERSGRLDS